MPGKPPPTQKNAKEQLVGIWTFVSSDNVAPDGTKRQTFGANPKGLMILDASGRYALLQVDSARPKFVSNNRLQGTPEENKAAVAGTVASFGTWSVNEADKTVVLHIEGSLYPNQEGTDGKRPIVSLTADELKWANPAPGAGGRSENVYKRAR